MTRPGDETEGAPAAGRIAAGRGATVSAPPDNTSAPGDIAHGSHHRFWRAAPFLFPALALLLVLVVYPIGYTFWRSLYDGGGQDFVGFDNYVDMINSESTRRALANNALWVLVAPTVATALGLIFAVLTERVRWATAFKLVVFMPMAISFLAAGIIFRLVYDAEPERGFANAALTSAREVFVDDAAYPGARPRPEAGLVPFEGGFASAGPLASDQRVSLPLVAVGPDQVPGSAEPASLPGTSNRLAGAVWLDFTRGGGGEPGRIDATEVGLPGINVQATRNGEVMAQTATSADGSFVFDDLGPGEYVLVLPADNFDEPWDGVSWLAPTLATWSIIGAYVWMWTGFAMVLIAAGLSAIPRDALEAARVDGASEWKVFTRVTVPLLAPVLLVVMVTLAINVLKVFDLVLVLAPQPAQDDATVLALEMWRVSFGGARDQGLGSALAVLLFLLVLPFMIFNIRRFLQDER